MSLTQNLAEDAVLQIETFGPIARLTLNREKQLNAFNSDLRLALKDAVEAAEADDAIRIVIVRGAGRGFCAGADISGGLDRPVSNQLNNQYKPALNGIYHSKKLYIAQCHGPVAGIGAALAQACDLMIMADDAYIYMAFAAIALIPDGGNTWLLLNNMGYRRALQAVVEGRKIPAKECLELGLANKLVPVDQLEDAAMAWAEDLAKGAPLAQAAAKRLLRSVGKLSYGDAISAEADEQDILSETKDFANAVEAFKNKQKPVFTGE